MFIRTKDGKIFDLENKKVSSWEYIDNDTAINEYGVEGAFYTIYYFDENEGHYSEYDNKGGHSCDFIEEKDIIKQSSDLIELCDYIVTKKPNHLPVLTPIGNKANIEIAFKYNKFMKNVAEWIKLAIVTDDGTKNVANVNLETGEVTLI